MAAGTLIGRGTELATIESFLRRVADGPACLVMVGEPGIGKTALWEAAVEDARRVQNNIVMVHRAVEAEATLSLTGLGDLVSPVFEVAAPSLPAPLRRALEVALLLGEPGEGVPTDQRAVGLALLKIFQVLAARGPVVLAIDDLQWLDSSTAAVLGIALRRLQTEPVGLLATVRQAPGMGVPLDLDRSFREGRLNRLSIGPLSLGDLHLLLRERVGLELTRPELSRVWEPAVGNPYFALELGRELVRTNTRPEVGRALRPTDSLRDVLVRRLTALPAATLDVLLVVAVLAQPTVELIAKAYGPLERVLDSLEVARREAVIGLDGESVRFVHPLLASICYEEATPWRRRTVHRLLAEAVNDVEERARHLALAAEGPDEGVAAELESAADRAAGRGATAAGAELAELAVRLTPGATQADRRRRNMRAAALHRLSGDLERASVILQKLLEDTPRGVDRADVLYALAINGRADLPTRARLCEAALAEAASDDVRCAEILGFLSITQWRLGDVPAALVSARAGLERAARTDDERLLAVALGRVGLVEFQAMEVTPGLLEQGIQIERRLERPLLFHDSPRFISAAFIQHQDQLDRARQIMEDVDATAASAGDEATRQWVALNMIPLEWYTGHWPRAMELAAVALEFAQQTQELQYRSMVQETRALVEADLGRLEEARHSAEEGVRFARMVSDEVSTIAGTAALGRVELLAGDLAAAGSHLRDLPDRLLSAAWIGPLSRDIWVDSIETLIGLGELERARRYLDVFEERAPLASRRWVAGAARCRGLLAAAARDFEAAFLNLHRALAELAGGLPAGSRPDAARAWCGPAAVGPEGARPRRAGRGPRNLRRARCPSLVLEGAAELGRISGRRSPAARLTETELRVATLASRGLSNREIASALFMGVSTVEAHLSRVYGKLGLRRAELATWLHTATEGEVRTP